MGPIVLSSEVGKQVILTLHMFYHDSFSVNHQLKEHMSLFPPGSEGSGGRGGGDGIEEGEEKIDLMSGRRGCVCCSSKKVVD